MQNLRFLSAERKKLKSNRRLAKSQSVFPNPRAADESGLLCIGGELSAEILLDAYRNGIFPWPREGLPMLWFSPPERGIVEFSELHWPRRFLRELTQLDSIRLSANTSFRDVVHACASVPRPHETGTWIVPEVIDGYEALFRLGYAYSVEAWRGTRLVGGMYGVCLDGFISGESMFFRESNMSKVCLFGLCRVAAQFGMNWIDIQMVTPALARFGGKYVSRDEFLRRLKDLKPTKGFQKFLGVEITKVLPIEN